nr:hypothetical protein [uncultured Oscillibacter sp.]
MDVEKIYVMSQTYSQPLRMIARIIEERESDAACVAQLRRFLERSGVPVRDRPSASEK